MPLIFSGSEEAQQVGLFEQIKDTKQCETYKTYNSCAFNEVPISETRYENFSTNKSEDSSLDLDSDSDKRPKHIYIFEDIEDDSIVETTALKQPSEPSNSIETSALPENFLTVSGTIKRGKKKGQNVEVVLNMSREELEILEADMIRKKPCPKGAGFM